MTTLRISDLSVGDWVQNDYGDYVKVAGIWQGCNFNYQVDILRDGRIGTIVPSCNIHPIPITAEILEKNGFGCIEEDTETALYGTPSCSIFHAKGTLRYRLDTPQASVVCWNIHDLQHALRLAGVEKEINL